jgi:comEA protein
MNNKEKVVLYFLIVSLLLGSGVSFYKRQKAEKNLAKIGTETIVITDTLSKISPKPEARKLKKEDSNILIDINYATAKELEDLPGIGPVLAQRIIGERERIGKFSAPEDLLKISGIGKKKLEKIKNKIIIKK